MMRELKRPVGSFLYRKIHRFLNMRTIRERMRKIHVVPEDELTRLCEEYCIRILSNSLLVFFWNIGLIRWSGSIYEPDKDFDCIEQGILRWR